jgi:hypothetical protein
MKLSIAADQALPLVGLHRLALAAYPRPVGPIPYSHKAVFTLDN